MRARISAALMAVFIVPLQEKGAWQVLEYSKIPANKVSFSAEGLSFKVNKSASPVIYPFSSVQQVSSVSLQGRLNGGLVVPATKKQGDKKADDFRIRLGLVTKGEQTLNWFQRQVAASWVKTLFTLAPKGAGVDKILFLNMVDDDRLFGKRRTHPVSELIEEHFVWKAEKGQQDYTFNHTFKTPKQVLALWLSSDGDDTKSSYELLIRQIKLTPPSL